MIASLFLAVAGVIALAAICLWLYIAYGVEEWSQRNRDERRRK